MPIPENFERVMQMAPDIWARRKIMKASFGVNDLVTFWKDGVEIEGRISQIRGEIVTVQTRFGEFDTEKSQISYQECWRDKKGCAQ